MTTLEAAVAGLADASLLVLDDDAPLRTRLGRALEARGFKATLVESVEQALESVAAAPPAFAVLDMRLDEHEDDICAGRPLRETVERLCGDLALSPDWSRWDGEGWMADDRPARSRFSPFNQPSSRPVLDAPASFPSARLQPSRDLE